MKSACEGCTGKTLNIHIISEQYQPFVPYQISSVVKNQRIFLVIHLSNENAELSTAQRRLLRLLLLDTRLLLPPSSLPRARLRLRLLSLGLRSRSRVFSSAAVGAAAPG